MTFSISTKGNTDIINITEKVKSLVEQSKIQEGLAVVFVKGSTAAVTTIEPDENLYNDLRLALDKIMPMNYSWQHHKTWGDNNGGSHLRASLLGPSVAIPVENGSLVLGTWQQIVLIDFDTSPRNRIIYVTLLHN